MTPALAEARLDELRGLAATTPGLYQLAKWRYYRDVLWAVADSAEWSPRLARIALRAEGIEFERLEGFGRSAAGSATEGGNALHP